MKEQLTEVFSEAIRYWERGRIAYNIVMIVIVGAVFVWLWPASRSAVTFDVFQGLFVMAVLANAFYCFAYVADVAMQLSVYRRVWLKYRWTLLVTGLVFAGVLTRAISAGMFKHPR